MSDAKESSKKGWLNKWFRSSPGNVSSEDTSLTEFNEDLWNTLKHSTAVEIRIAKLNQLSKFIENNQMERKIVEKLWIETKDLLNSNLPRHITTSYFGFLNVLIKSQYRQLGMLKPMLYQDLKDLRYTHQDDILNVMFAINYLTDEGKNLSMIESEVSNKFVYLFY